MSSQELRKFSSIELMPDNRHLPGESFSIQGVSERIQAPSSKSLALTFTAEP